MMEEIEKLTGELSRLSRILDRIDSIKSTNSSSNIHINAGGMGIVIALGACLLCMTVAMGCGFAFISSKQEINRQDQKIERMQDYLQNIYQQAPWLKPKESK